MNVLRISLFGTARIAHSGATSEIPVTGLTQTLLAFLLLQGQRSHPREKLAGLFWGDYDEERARSCLRTTLYRLRRHLEPRGIPRETYLLTSPAGEVGFNWKSAHWLDVAAFEECASRVLAQPSEAIEPSDTQALESALHLYSGELLEGIYEDWALRERERLHRLYLNCLAHLMRYYKHHGAYEQSLAHGKEILNHDPLREDIHREVMRLYLSAGQRAKAVEQYKACRDILRAELGIGPMKETRALYAEIVSRSQASGTRSAGGQDPACVEQALQQIQVALRAFEAAEGQLRRATWLVERIQTCWERGCLNATE